MSVYQTVKRYGAEVSSVLWYVGPISGAKRAEHRPPRTLWRSEINPWSNAFVCPNLGASETQFFHALMLVKLFALEL
jgi:hypothetical protein